MEKDFLTIKEAAAMLNVTALTLRNWDKAGKFTASRHPINNYRVYRRAEVEMFIEDMRSKNWTTPKVKYQRSVDSPAPIKSSKKLSIKHEDW